MLWAQRGAARVQSREAWARQSDKERAGARCSKRWMLDGGCWMVDGADAGGRREQDSARRPRECRARGAAWRAGD